jgi:DNA-binding CsgD family transcriptional regulator
MEQLILWFNIIAFTLIFGSLGATWMVYGRMKTRWMRPYLFYLSDYAFYTIFNTYGFFSQVYLPRSNPLLNSAVMFTSLFTALFLLYIVPRFIRSLLSRDEERRWRMLPTVIIVLYLFLMLTALLKKEWHIDRTGSALMNGYLGGISLYGLIRLRPVRRREAAGVLVPFLYLSTIFYFIVVLQALILPLVTSPVTNLRINIFTAGLICFLWGGITLAYLMIRSLRPESAAVTAPNENFAADFGITPRESEIIAQLLQGKSNKEIGEQLFVSPRTVEAHVYNIYRKCSVKNKMELAHRISTSR